VILTKGFAIEGTALMAKQRAKELAGVLSETQLRRCANLLHTPGISVVKDAQLAQEAGGVHALHDPTEGGVATGLWELAQAADVGLVIEEARLPILPECQALCDHFGLDPLGLIGSGALLISAARNSADAIVKRLESENIRASVIGEVVDRSEGLHMRRATQSMIPLPTFARDEIARLFE